MIELLAHGYSSLFTLPNLARICRHVYAVDASEAMVAAVGTKTAKQKLDNVTAEQAKVLTYEHEGNAPDGIIAENLKFFGNLTAWLRPLMNIFAVCMIHLRF